MFRHVPHAIVLTILAVAAWNLLVTRGYIGEQRPVQPARVAAQAPVHQPLKLVVKPAPEAARFNAGDLRQYLAPMTPAAVSQPVARPQSEVQRRLGELKRKLGVPQ